MKWTTAVRTLADVAQRCTHMAAQPTTIVRLRVDQAWVFGDLLGPHADQLDDLTGVRVALVADVPEDECALLTLPHAAGHWLAASGLEKKPAQLFFRSAHAPVWNHLIARPVRFWSSSDGLDETVLDRLRAGGGEGLRPAAPSAADLAARLERDLAVSLAAVRRTQDDYAEHRWAPGSPVKRADALADATAGYLELHDALRTTG